jgi:hypothetical protein
LYGVGISFVKLCDPLVLPAPVPATPTAEDRAIDSATFTILKSTVLAARILGQNTETLYDSRSRIDIERAVAHAEGRVARCNLFQSLCHVYPAIPSAVLCPDDSIFSTTLAPVTIMVSIMVPVSIPVTPVIEITVAPIAAAPTGEQGAIHGAAFAVFESAGSATRTSGQNPQHFYSARRGIHLKRTIPHAEVGIGRGDLPEPARNVNPAIINSILGPNDAILTRVNIIAVTATIAAAVTTTVAAAVAPITSAPAAEHGAIHSAALAVFECAFSSPRASRKNAQCLHSARGRIHIEGAIAHAESFIRGRDFTQPACDVNPAVSRSVLGAHDPILTRIGIVSTAAPSAPATTASPAREHGPIYGAAFTILKTPFATAAITRHNSQSLYNPWGRIHPKRAVSHAKRGIARGNALQLSCNINPAAASAVLSAHNLIVLRQGSRAENQPKRQAHNSFHHPLRSHRKPPRKDSGQESFWTNCISFIFLHHLLETLESYSSHYTVHRTNVKQCFSTRQKTPISNPEICREFRVLIN